MTCRHNLRGTTSADSYCADCHVEQLQKDKDLLECKYHDAVRVNHGLSEKIEQLQKDIEQEKEIRESREDVITFISEYLKVEPEPHQTFFERLLDTAEQLQKDNAAKQEVIDRLVEAVSTLSDDLELAGKHLRDLGHANKQKYCDSQVKEYKALINSIGVDDE